MRFFAMFIIVVTFALIITAYGMAIYAGATVFNDPELIGRTAGQIVSGFKQVQE